LISLLHDQELSPFALDNSDHLINKKISGLYYENLLFGAICRMQDNRLGLLNTMMLSISE